MSDAITRWVLRVLRVPPEPHLPPGAPGSARVFRAGRNYWRLLLIVWTLRQVSAFVGLVVVTGILARAPDLAESGFSEASPEARQAGAAGLSLFRVLEAMGWIAWLVQLPITYRITRLGYELRWYIVTDRAARLREGILRMREMTLTLVNVQDIQIRQGPLQRLLGISDVELRTAGGSDSSGMKHDKENPFKPNLHVARFKAVENAQEIRDLVRERMRHARDSGLGDPDDAPVAAAHGDGQARLHVAAERVREEARALRHVAERLGGTG